MTRAIAGALLALAGCDQAIEPAADPPAIAPSPTPAVRTEFVARDVVTAKGRSFRGGEVLVKLRIDAGDPTHTGVAAIDETFARFGVSEFRPVYPGATGDLARVFHVVSRGDAEALQAALAALDDVEYAEVNLIAKTHAAPNDPYYSSVGAWGQNFRDQWGLTEVRAEEAWDLSSGEDVVIAVVDSGIDYEHPDIADNVYRNPGELGTDGLGGDRSTNGIDDDGNGYVDDVLGYDFANLDADPMDDNGHGTHCAGIIAAVTDNGIGIAGVAPRAKVLAVKNIDASGNGDLDSTATAIFYAAQSGARVINLSQGFDGYSQTLHDAVRYAHDVAGAVVVVAAGNSSANVGDWYDDAFGIVRFPAAAREVITVSALDHTRTLASFSNFGTKIDVAAPGGGGPTVDGDLVAPHRTILSLYSRQTGRAFQYPEQVVDGRYYRVSGTSQAAPVVAGVAALLLARNPYLGPEQVRQAIRRSALDVGTSGIDLQTGHGLVDARAALEEPEPLVAHLTGPVAVIASTREIEISGSAHGPGFAGYQLSWGAGEAPTAWHTIAASFDPVEASTLTQWDLREVSEGDVTLRLTVMDTSGAVYEDRLLVHVDNVSFSEPKPHFAPTASYRGGQVYVRGTVMPASFDHYGIVIRGARTGEVEDPALVLTGDGRSPIESGELATWDLSGVPPDRYELTLRVTLTTGEVLEETTALTFDPMVHAGTPIALNAPSDYLQRGLTVADIDGDGASEMLFYAGSAFHVMRHDGTELRGFPVSAPEEEIDLQGGLAAGDIDGDGRPEVVGAAPGGLLHAFRTDGSLLPGFPLEGPTTAAPVSLSDIDGDGVLDIVTVGAEGLVVVRGDGHRLEGFAFAPADAGLGAHTTTRAEQTSTGDLDGDGREEIVVMVRRSFDAGDLQELYAFDSDGTIRPGWPRKDFTTPIWVPTMPTLGDLEGDGNLEVLVANTSEIYALGDDGTTLPGWPRRGAYPTDMGPAIVGDFDGDPGAEIFAGSDVAYDDVDASLQFDVLTGLSMDGNPLPGWPVLNRNDTWEGANGYFGFGMPLIADIDGDAKVELIAQGDTAKVHAFGPFAYHRDGTPVSGWPRPTSGIPAHATSMPAVADLDGDGLLELAYFGADTRPEREGAPQGRIHVLDLEAPATAHAPWPMFHADARRSGHVELSGAAQTSDTASDPPTTDDTDGSSGAADTGSESPESPVDATSTTTGGEMGDGSDGPGSEPDETRSDDGGGCAIAVSDSNHPWLPPFLFFVVALVQRTLLRRPRWMH